jgi:hypothetical protein
MKKSRKIMVGLIVLCCVLLLVAFIVGISDNPPGLALCYLATVSLILAFVHTWRKAWKFLILLGASVIGFAVFAILHNVFYALAEISSDIVVLSQMLKFLDAASFLIAIFVFPAGLLIGAIGGMLTAAARIKERQACNESSHGC